MGKTIMEDNSRRDFFRAAVGAGALLGAGAGDASAAKKKGRGRKLRLNNKGTAHVEVSAKDSKGLKAALDAINAQPGAAGTALSGTECSTTAKLTVPPGDFNCGDSD